MDYLPSVVDPFKLANPNIKIPSTISYGWAVLFAPTLLLGCSSILLCKYPIKLRCNFYNVAPIQNSSKLDFAFSLHCARFARCLNIFYLLFRPLVGHEKGHNFRCGLFFGCLTWIRTKTNCTKNSCATVTPSGNPLAILGMECKNRGQRKIFQIFMTFLAIILKLS